MWKAVTSSIAIRRTMPKKRVLFVCIHNSARSQMAEELLRKLGGERFDVESAGLEPGKLNPLAVEILREKGIDITGKKTQKVFDLFTEGRRYHYVITVCDEASAERCPIFPGAVKKLHWSFPDPSTLTGSHQEKLTKIRTVRNTIEHTIRKWLTTNP